MQKTCLFIIVLCLSALTRALAQNFTAADMILYSGCDNSTCFNNFIRQKGYKFEKHEEGEKIIVYRFPSEQYDENGNARLNNRIRSMVTYDVHKDGEVKSFSYWTIDGLKSDKLLTEFKEMGYAIIDVFKMDDGVLAKYKSKRTGYPIMTAKIEQQTFDGIGFKFFKLTVYQGTGE